MMRVVGEEKIVLKVDTVAICPRTYGSKTSRDAIEKRARKTNRNRTEFAFLQTCTKQQCSENWRRQ
jgi:hypothetical protein